MLIIIIISPIRMNVVNEDERGDLESLYKACQAAITDGGLFTDTGCVEKCYYLGDVLDGEGGVGFAVIARVRWAWKNFRELSGRMLTRRTMSIKLKGKVCGMCPK